MKQIFHEYGTTVISILTAFCILGILFLLVSSESEGIRKLVGTSDIQESVEFGYRDTKAALEWAEREKPKVFHYQDTGRLIAGESIRLLECFYMQDAEGETYPLDSLPSATVCEIKNRDGESILGLYDEINDELCIEKAGVYSVCISVSDREHKEGIWNLPLVVDEGGNED